MVRIALSVPEPLRKYLRWKTLATTSERPEGRKFAEDAAANEKPVLREFSAMLLDDIQSVRSLLDVYEEILKEDMEVQS